MFRKLLKFHRKNLFYLHASLYAAKRIPELSDCPLPLHYIGDCAGERPSNIDHAIKSAYDVACEI